MLFSILYFSFLLLFSLDHPPHSFPYDKVVLILLLKVKLTSKRKSKKRVLILPNYPRSVRGVKIRYQILIPENIFIKIEEIKPKNMRMQEFLNDLLASGLMLYKLNSIKENLKSEEKQEKRKISR